MKKIFLPIVVAALALVGCKEKTITEPSAEGSLSLELASSDEGFQIVTKANDNVDDFIIEIVRPYDRWSVSYIYGEIKGEMISLGAGDYTITAHSPESADAAWDLPIYGATQEFSIKAGEVTPISLTCELTNVKVTIALSDNFKRELSTYDVTVSNGKGKLTWVKEGQQDDFAAGKAGYFTVAPLDVLVTGHRTVDDSEATTTLSINNVVAKNHHIITIDAKVTGQIGGDTDGDGVADSGIQITVDPAVNVKDEDVYVDGLEEIPVDGGEDEDTGDDEETDQPVEPEPSTVPYIVWEANQDFAEMNLDDKLNANLVIKAPEKITEFLVTVESPTIKDLIPEITADGTNVLDPINNEGTISLMKELELPYQDQIAGQTSVDFFITELLGLITELKPAAGTKHPFILYVKDQKGQELTQTITFVSVAAAE